MLGVGKSRVLILAQPWIPLMASATLPCLLASVSASVQWGVAILNPLPPRPLWYRKAWSALVGAWCLDGVQALSVTLTNSSHHWEKSEKELGWAVCPDLAVGERTSKLRAWR